MENASKALIIAGAILLSILIIAIGMYIYTSSHNSISEAGSQISEQEKTSFNQQWNTYEGAQGGNNVKALLQKIIANCNTNAQEEQRLVDVQFGNDSADTSKGEVKGISTVAAYSAAKTVKIEVTGDDASSLTSYDGIGTNAYTPGGAVKALNLARNGIEARHTYQITISYSPKTSLVDLITIAYQ